MLDTKYRYDKDGRATAIETSISGKALLMIPQLNKGTAFSEQERIEFKLQGKLPVRIENLEEQVSRAYKQFDGYNTKLQKNIYLNNLLNENQVLFYKLVSEHLDEMMPVIYTPIVGSAVKEFSLEFRQPRGLYLSYPHADQIEKLLDNRSNNDIDLIVMTDGEGVLGIGDQGVGGMDIPIAKLMVYTLCAGINPNRTLPILFDVGTNNEKLLNDPFYLGWRHERLHGKEYQDFIDHCIGLISKKFPHVFLHWEDFGRENARRHYDLYKNQVCTFNDDMQGTGVVTLAAIIAAIKAGNTPINEQRIVVLGAGTAGTGISDQIVEALIRTGMTREEANRHFWLVDKQGLLTADMQNLTSAQEPYARPIDEVEDWDKQGEHYISLADTVRNVQPTILIGCSSVEGAFTEEIITEMTNHVARPIILPLSNPSEHCEAKPEDILKWTQSRALVATGSPFEPVEIHGKTYRIAQCNNAFVFPGLGLGIIASKAKRLTDNMLWAACEALAQLAPISHGTEDCLLPKLGEAREVSEKIAIAVAMAAINDGVADKYSEQEMQQKIDNTVWDPHYLPLQHCE